MSPFFDSQACLRPSFLQNRLAPFHSLRLRPPRQSILSLHRACAESPSTTAIIMDYRGQRPPRSARPPQSPAPPYQSQSSFNTRSPPPAEPIVGSPRGISFQNTERGDRQSPLDQNHARTFSAYQPQSPPSNDPSYTETGGFLGGDVGRKKSLVRPDREKIEPGHRQFHYHNRVANLQEGGNIDIIPSGASWCIAASKRC